MTWWRGTSITVSDDDARGTFYTLRSCGIVNGTVFVMLRSVWEYRKQNIRRQ